MKDSKLCILNTFSISFKRIPAASDITKWDLFICGAMLFNALFILFGFTDIIIVCAFLITCSVVSHKFIL